MDLGKSTRDKVRRDHKDKEPTDYYDFWIIYDDRDLLKLENEPGERSLYSHKYNVLNLVNNNYIFPIEIYGNYKFNNKLYSPNNLQIEEIFQMTSYHEIDNYIDSLLNLILFL